MHDLPRDKLRELIVEYGRSLCDDPRRCEALLKDHCGQYKREIFVLVSALKNRVAEDLFRAQSAGLPETMVWSRARQRLEEELAMTADAAQWAVESWALALGLIVQPSPVARSASVASSPPPIAQKTRPTPSTAPSGTVITLLGGRYRDHGDGTVTDVKTGLQWMRCSLGQNWKGGTCVGEAKEFAWRAAMKAAETLNRQNGYAGYRDWRLPTRDELVNLVYCSNGRPKTWNDSGGGCQGDYDRPTIYQTAFPNTPISYFWSSSPDADNTYFAFYLFFGDGYSSSYGDRNHSHRVRLVRVG